MTGSFNRRRVLGAAAVGALGLATAPSIGRARQAATPVASALSPTLPTGGVQADGTWAFTDDLGNVISAPATPTRVVAHVGIAAALHDFGFDVVGYYNPATDADGKPLQIAGDLPLDQITHIGDYDEIDLEQLLSLKPELFIGQNYSVEMGGMWPFSDDVLAQIAAIAPIVYLAYGDGADVERNIRTVENLAAALGADVNTTEIAASRDAFLAASDELRRALATKPNLTALYISGYDAGFWVDSASSASTGYFRSLGMTITPPPLDDSSGEYEVSWEQFLNFPADAIVLDDRRPNWWSAEQLADSVAVWSHHPAVKAGQVFPWRAQFISSYKGFTPILTETTAWVNTVDDTVTAP